MSQTPTKASPCPAGWNLWIPTSGIVFGDGTSTSAPATFSAASRTAPLQSAAAPRQQPAWSRVVYPQLPHAAYSAPAVPFVSRREIHSAALNSTELSTEQLAAEPGEEAIVDEHIKEDRSQEHSEEEEKDGRRVKPEQEEVALPETTLEFKIPDNVFRAARGAAEGTPESYFSYAMYRRPAADNTGKESSPSAPTAVKVHYCKTKHTTERVCNEYFKGEPLLGFDLEWMRHATRFQGARQNVCLMQLASPSRIGLFHISLYPKGKEGDPDSDLVGPVLRSILEDASSIKAGVAIKGDATRVRKHLGINMRGVFELSHLHNLVVYSKTGETHRINKKLVSLANQASQHLRLPMFKGQDVRSGDWSRALAMDQIIYSASDAYAAVQIFSILDKQRQELKPKPPLPAFVEQNLPIKLADGVVPAAAEEPSEAEEDVEDNIATSAKRMTPEYMARATTTVEIEAEGDSDAGPSTPANKAATSRAKTPGTPRSSRSPKPPATPDDPRITAAKEWLARYCVTVAASGGTVRARPASLRAYYLWHSDPTLDPKALAALLRDPPLQENTVMSYILEAVQLESLPYAKTRMRAELLDQMPADLLKRRYAYISKVCGYS